MTFINDYFHSFLTANEDQLDEFEEDMYFEGEAGDEDDWYHEFSYGSSIIFYVSNNQEN